eukprot:scaffold647815_cov23-Prasinocladus_malaysianus.AAC.1
MENLMVTSKLSHLRKRWVTNLMPPVENEVQTLAVVPSLIPRLLAHLGAPGQQYGAMPPALHLLAALAHGVRSNRGTRAAYPYLRPLFSEPLAKLLAATIGFKNPALAQQAMK